MRSRYIFPFWLLCFAATTTCAQDQPGAAEGRKIGTIVRGAIETALPGVQPLLDLLWKNRSEKDKLTKDQLKQQIKDATEGSDGLLSQAQKKVQPVSALSEELRIVNEFLEPSIVAKENVTKMQTRLFMNQGPSEELWKLQQQDWDVAKANLKAIQDTPDADLNKVQDLWLRNMLKRIQTSNRDLIIRIDSDLGAKNVSGLAEQLKELFLTLRDVSAVAGYEITNLGAGIKSLSDWAHGAQSAPDSQPSTPRSEAYRRILDKRYPQ